MNKRLIALFVIISLFALPLGFVLYKNQQTSAITVVGSHKQDSPLGEVSFIVSKGNAAADLNTAINDNETQIKNLIDIVKRIGGPDSEVKKSFYQVTPGTGQYVVANAFGVTVKNPARLDTLVRQLYMAGATSISNLSMVAADKDNVEKELRQKAVADANKNATAIASSIGKSIKRIVSIADDQASPASTVSPDGSNQTIISLNKNVTVVYEIW